MASARARRYSMDLAKYYRKASTQVSLSVVLSLFIVAFFIMAALRPTFVTIAKLNTEIEDTEQTLNSLKTKSAALVKAAQVWEEIQPQLPYVEASIPQDGPYYERITKAIELLATEAGVELVNVNLDKALLYSQVVNIYTGRKQAVIELPTEVRIRGGFLETLSFLEALLTIDRLYKVESITMSKEVESGQSIQVGMTISGTTSYLADQDLLNKTLKVGGK